MVALVIEKDEKVQRHKVDLIQDILSVPKEVPSMEFPSLLGWAREAHDVVVGISAEKYNGSLDRWQIRMIERCLMTSEGLIITSSPDLTRSSILPTIVVDEKEDLDFVRQLGLDLAAFRFHNHYVRRLSDLYESCGWAYSQTPAIMLVGEHYPQGHIGDESGQRAFGQLTSSSMFLHHAVDLFPDTVASRIYLTNLWKVDDDTRAELFFLEERSLVRPARVVALGKKVAMKLNEMGIEHGEASHPQHAAKLFSQAIDHYANELIHAIGDMT